MKISNIIKHNYPFDYYTFSNIFNENEMNQIKHIDLFAHSAQLDGERTNNRNRFFANKENIKDYAVIDNIVNYFLNADTINRFEDESNRKISGNFLRVEFIEDKEESWLKPHVDIYEKIMSMLIYINTTNEDENIGTSLYNEKMEHVKTVPYINNTGFYFYPNKNTWHGLEPIKIKKCRKAIMINYCTFETEFKL